MKDVTERAEADNQNSLRSSHDELSGGPFQSNSAWSDPLDHPRLPPFRHRNERSPPPGPYLQYSPFPWRGYQVSAPATIHLRRERQGSPHNLRVRANP